MGDNDNASASGKDEPIALCASCDRCRARKTKCDGNRPCGNCATKYMKKHKIESVEGIDLAEFECVYSPAKRRGPIPGKTGQTRKASDINLVGASNMSISSGGHNQGQPQFNNFMMEHQQNAEWGAGGAVTSAWNGSGGGGSTLDPQAAAAAFLGTAGMDANASNAVALQQLGFLQQLQVQQQAQAQQQQQQQQQQQAMNGGADVNEPSARRIKSAMDEAGKSGPPVIPRTITDHTHLLERSDPEGSRLYAYYKLSIDEMFRLPPTPTDEDYCSRMIPPMTPRMIPGSHLAALSAARFAEIALGALVHNEVSLAMELCNAVVHCLRESVQEPVHTQVMFEVAKAYFLLGVFRSCRGDMARYFKYRRVCMTYLAKLEDDEGTATLLAAVSFLDSWAYMIYNANEKLLPSFDDIIPPVSGSNSGIVGGTGMGGGPGGGNSLNDIKTDPASIACDPKNQNWIQGAPPVYLNNEAPLPARSLDAIACAIRTCCDQANSRFACISREAAQLQQGGENGMDNSQKSNSGSNNANGNNGPTLIPQDTIITPTTTAVLAHENELCSRNLVLSAYTLMQQHDAQNKGKFRHEGQHMVISAMDAFLENSDEEGQGGFTDSQIQSLLSVCNTALENPYLLHHAGPTYHMVTNAAILLCHLLNGMYAMRNNGGFGSMEATLFEEILDTFIPIRKLLTIHRRKLPVKLRCHGVPRPSFDLPKERSSSSSNGSDTPSTQQPFIDLGETLLCSCRGCQGFVLMACSPCVAAERARSATSRMNVEQAQEAAAVEMGEIDKELDDLGAEFDMDDDALLGIISSLISN